jgi:RNase adapter protein RapZ
MATRPASPGRDSTTTASRRSGRGRGGVAKAPDVGEHRSAGASADASGTRGVSVRREPEQRVVILSGLSGAGKTAATKLFEDLGYICMDNVPGELLPDLAELVSVDRQRFEKVAIVLDVRSGNAPLALAAMRGALEGRGIKPRVIFLEARDEVLIRRFSETRHRHPLAGRRGIAGSIAEERRRLDPVRADSDIVVDTSDLSLRQLKERIFAQLNDVPSDQGLVFQLISFGFKYGVPLEADLVFDVRFMENPYYVDSLRHLSGLTPAVRDYVMGQPIAHQFFDFLAGFLELTVPGFRSEGKTRLTIAIGCTGGYHRSIAITEELREWLDEKGFGTVAVFHRELERA